MKNLSIVPDWKPSNADLWIEFQLTHLMTEIHQETNKERLTLLWGRYRELHAQRSPEYVEYLERKKGIHRP